MTPDDMTQDGELNDIIASFIPETIVLRIRGDRSKDGSCFMTDPTTGELIVRPEFQDAIGEALVNEARSICDRIASRAAGGKKY